MSASNMANRAPTRYTDPRAHHLRAEYLATFGGDEIPVPVESIAEDWLGLRIEEDDLGDCSGMLIPSRRLIVVNAAEANSGETPTRRIRSTIATICSGVFSPPKTVSGKPRRSVRWWSSLAKPRSS